MKRANYIYALAFVLATVSACETKQWEQPMPDNNEPSSYLPIEFGIDIIDTRAQIVEGGENATLDELGVIGYQYANQTGSNWSTAKSTARPDVFDNHPHRLTLGDGDNYYVIDGNTTTDSEGNTIPKYTWSGNKYAFFAIYPRSHSSMTLSGANIPNTPYVTYTVDRNDVDNMADVMTSARKDLTATNRYVTFHMLHRLSAVDVEVHNIYEYSYTADETTHYENIDIEIVDLKLTFNKLHYDSSKIYLDESEVISMVNAGAATSYKGQVPTKGNDTSAEYHLISEDAGDDAIVVPFKDNENNDNYHLTADKSMTMFFIPQDEDDLEVSVNVKFRKKRPGGSYLINDNYNYEYDENGSVTSSTPADGYGTEYFFAEKNTAFEQSLDEGYRYYVSLNFTSAAVSINIITAAQWTDQEIDHEFE